MARHSAVAVVLVLAAAASTGCAVAAGVAVGAGVIHATGDDTLEVTLRAPPSRVYDEAAAVLRERGTVDATRAVVREIEGSVDGATTTITVLPTAEQNSRLRVKSRRNVGISPDLETAERVASWVIQRVHR